MSDVNLNNVRRLVQLGILPESILKEYEEKTLGGFGKNLVGSGVQLGTDMWDAVTSPIDTGAALLKAGAGGVQKLIPGKSEDGLIPNYEDVADAVADYYVDRFSNIGDTAYEDPLGLLSDLAFGAGSALKGSAKIAKIAGASDTAGTLQKLGDRADLMDPVNTAIGGAGRVGAKLGGGVKGAISRTSENVKYSTARNSPERKQGAAERMSETMLKYGLDPTNPASLKKLEQIIKDFEAQSTEAVANAGGAGVKIDPMPALDALAALSRRTYSTADPDAAKKVGAIDQYALDAEEALLRVADDDLMLDPATALKTRRDVDAGINYGAEKPKASARAQARQEYANALRSELAEMIPGLKEVNQDFSRALEIKEPMTRATRRHDNNTNALTKMGAVGGAVMTAASGGIYPLLVGALSSGFLSPRTQQALAQIIYERASGRMKLSDNQLASLSMRILQEIEQTGVANEQ